MKAIHLWLAAITMIGSAHMAHAQRTYVPPPYISRVCLWNADKETWRALDLERAQIQRLAELRQQFPAVVDGQWMDPGDEERDRITGWRGGPIVSTSYNGDLSTTTGSAGSTNTSQASTLQTELRKLLSEEKLRAWERMCKAE